MTVHISETRRSPACCYACAPVSRYFYDPRVLLEGTTSWHSSCWKWFGQVQRYCESLINPRCTMACRCMRYVSFLGTCLVSGYGPRLYGQRYNQVSWIINIDFDSSHFPSRVLSLLTSFIGSASDLGHGLVALSKRRVFGRTRPVLILNNSLTGAFGFGISIS